jgi:hypothetical protein
MTLILLLYQGIIPFRLTACNKFPAIPETFARLERSESEDRKAPPGALT